MDNRSQQTIPANKTKASQISALIMQEQLLGHSNHPLQSGRNNTVSIFICPHSLPYLVKGRFQKSFLILPVGRTAGCHITYGRTDRKEIMLIIFISYSYMAEVLLLRKLCLVQSRGLRKDEDESLGTARAG